MTMPDGRNFAIDLSPLSECRSKTETSEFFAKFLASLPPKPFAVGDTITTQDEADRLPDRTILVASDEQAYRVDSRHYSHGGKDHHTLSFAEFGDEMSGFTLYELPATIIWLPPETSQDGVL